MPAVQYPFIDIAVHERVKDHFARGEALVLFSVDLKDVLWANGAGARLFGKPVLYDLIEDGPNSNDVTFRQVETTAHQLRAEGDSRGFLIRIPSGFQRVPVQAVVERIRLTRDVDALLFAAPVSASPLKIETIAADMLKGFDDPDTHMAVLGGDGEVLAASTGFGGLNLTPATARGLVTMVGAHAERLVKRPIPTAKGYLPAAIGKVSDTPPMHLLFAVETILGNMGPASGFPEEEHPGTAAEETAPAAPQSFMDDTAASVTPDAPADDPVADGPAESHGSDATDIPGETAAGEDTASFETAEESLAGDETAAPEAPEPGAEDDRAAESVETDGSTNDAPDRPDEAAAGETQAGDLPSGEDAFRVNRAARPTRFVWKIDANGHFSEVSPELADAVGPHASSLSGVAFTDIASLLDLDPEGKIAELLGRRDTWSGKTIYWPIEGTSLRAPVDLAALPTYKRNREFDGFRGFGIVRLSDAIEDPQAIGLTLGDAPETAAREDEATARSTLPETSEPTAEEEKASAELLFGDDANPEQDPGEPEQGADLGDGSAGIQETATAGPAEDMAEMTAEAANDAEAVAGPEMPQPEAEAPRPEPPVFRRVTAAPESDKIIKLEERRLRNREGLTPGEQEAFREIARQLEPFRREDEDERLVADEADASAAGTPGHGAEPEAGPASPFAEAGPAPLDEREAAENDGNGRAESEASSGTEEAAASAAEDEASRRHLDEQLEILASSIPARTAMSGGLTADVIDEIPVALLIHAGDRLIHANPEFLKLSGYDTLSALEAVGGLDSLLHHRDLEDMPERSGGLSLVRADDSLVPVTARLQSVRWEDANALLLALIPSGPRPQTAPETDVRDPDEERLNQRIEELQVEVDELRSILETATDGVVIIGPEGDIRSMNRSASALFDYDEAETRGKPFVMLFAHESHRAVADYLSGMTGHGVASVLNDGREVIGREASGGFIPLFMTIGRLSASNGFCAVIRDITQWKRTEEDLKNAKRAAETANAHKSEFLARVSHEIRTPLNAIIGFSDMMAIEHFGPIGHPRYVEYANDIARSGRLVLDIVNDLLDISKIEAGEMDLEFTAVGLNDAVSEAVALVQPQAQASRVIIRTAFSESVPDVVADLRSIKQIVLNILANAIRFTQAGGQIVVSTAYEPNGSVVLRIRDTGVGMTRAELEQAMKPFRQVTPGTRKRGDGTGLGLPLTKAMVDANRANFTIQSAPNEGTLVEITFPSPRVLAN
ncbi:ATP-binding protein [Gellertiella hungarica]|uniref:histidine kinase n=1 Tax=Gellertiella hungarica TaxID=1572859 RepID=A0A7W6NJA3_9HYPH|nr:ATP-binding protein [Gellertiella hungarica]MBB4064175.1 PAS domain S-box-containing protein [Gellertiella hungarica]